jgi:hypothetical protein
MLVVGYVSLIGKGKLTIILYLFNRAHALIATVSSYLQTFIVQTFAKGYAIHIRYLLIFKLS